MRFGKDEAGDWRGLCSQSQVLRYGTIAEMLSNNGVGACVLDVGCGEAVLRGWLPKSARYVGVERSALAVKIALERDPSATIVNTRAETFDSHGERFDSVVFNEMLYYTVNPVGLLRKYAPLVRQGGVILCSIYHKAEGASWPRRVWHRLDCRRPLSNVHCEEMVRAFMAREAWPIVEDRAVCAPGRSYPWHIWAVMPR